MYKLTFFNNIIIINIVFIFCARSNAIQEGTTQKKVNSIILRLLSSFMEFGGRNELAIYQKLLPFI
jgi:hypothetical protein